MNIAASYRSPAKSWKHMELKVGDKVKIRSWDDLYKEFGKPKDRGGSIQLYVDDKLADVYTREMGSTVSGKIITIETEPHEFSYYHVARFSGWYISWPMVEPV